MPADEIVPIFPLDDVVLFPGARAPLHIFEPRYRQMMAAALAGGRVIGMVTVRPDHADDMRGNPAVFPIGCAGEIEQHEELPDGRYNLVLRGVHRFRIAEEQDPEGDRLYRRARIEVLAEEEIDAASAPRVHAIRERVARLLDDLLDRTRERGQEDAVRRLAALDDCEFANALCQGLGLPVEERQALLEASGPAARIDALEGMLTFHLARARAPSAAGSDRVH